MAAMLDVSGENVLDVIAERVAALIDADLVALAVPHGRGRVPADRGARLGSGLLRDRVYPAAGSLADAHWRRGGP